MPPVLNYPGTPGTTLRGGLPDPSVGGIIATFSLENWGTVSSTRTLFRGGMPFKKGDVPAGSVPEICRAGGAPIVAQFDERSTWSDGSLKFAVCHMRDSDLAASGSQEYEVYAVTGSFDNTGATTLASVVAANTLSVEFSSLAQWNGTSSATRESGDALAAFASAAAVATRVTKIHSGPVCEGWQVWGMVKDLTDGTGAEDAHLKAIWYVDVWKDATDAVIDTEFAAEIAQDWWAVANKFRLDYTATLKRNGTTVQAYTGIQHPYRSRWLTARMQDDNNHGKRHWVGAVPSLAYKFDKAYWKSTRLIPPLHTTFVPNTGTKATYVPLGNMQHRASIDDAGGYNGRGVWPRFDVVAFMRQTGIDARNARTNAFAGLHIPCHFRDDRTRTRPSESADVANTLIPLRWVPKADAASTFIGLPAPKHAYNGTIYNNIADRGGYADETGGEGVWNTSNDSSHAPAFSTFAYMLEGERYMWEAMIDLATASAHNLTAGQYGGMPYIHWYDNASSRAEMSVPSLQWTGIPAYTVQGNERSIGWATNLIAGAAGLAPDNDPQGQYMKAWNAHCADYLSECVTYQPPSAKQVGQTYNAVGSQANLLLHWHSGFVVMGLMQNRRMTEEAGYDSYANMALHGIVGSATNSLYNLVNNYSLTKITVDPYSSAHTYFTPSQILTSFEVSVASEIVTFPSDLLYSLQNDDEVYFTRNLSKSLPSGYTEGTKLFVVSPSGKTCRLSTTSGGSPISIPNGTYSVGIRAFGDTNTIAAFPPYLPPPDSFLPIARSALLYAEDAALADMPAGLAAEIVAFTANVDFSTDPRWNMTLT